MYISKCFRENGVCCPVIGCVNGVRRPVIGWLPILGLFGIGSRQPQPCLGQSGVENGWMINDGQQQRTFPELFPQSWMHIIVQNV